MRHGREEGSQASTCGSWTQIRAHTRTPSATVVHPPPPRTLPPPTSCCCLRAGAEARPAATRGRAALPSLRGGAGAPRRLPHLHSDHAVGWAAAPAAVPCVLDACRRSCNLPCCCCISCRVAASPPASAAPRHLLPRPPAQASQARLPRPPRPATRVFLSSACLLPRQVPGSWPALPFRLPRTSRPPTSGRTTTATQTRHCCSVPRRCAPGAAAHGAAHRWRDHLSARPLAHLPACPR